MRQLSAARHLGTRSDAKARIEEKVLLASHAPDVCTSGSMPSFAPRDHRVQASLEELLRGPYLARVRDVCGTATNLEAGDQSAY